MNLQDILIDAGAGFALGLALGLKGYPEKPLEKLELYKLIPEDEREKKLTKKEIKNLERGLKISKLTLPFAFGSMYCAAASLFSQDYSSFPNNFVTAISSAYLGRFIGSRIRKLKTGKKFEEQKNEFKANRDVANLYKYYLPKDKQEVLEKAFSEIEQLVLDGKEKEITEGVHGAPAERVYNVIMESKTKYTSLLLMWGLAKQAELIERAGLQKNIKEFYEKGLKDALEDYSCAHGMIIGPPENARVKVFTKQGGDFYIQTMEVPNLKLIRDDDTGVFEVEGKGEAKINSTEREIWTDDYKALADRVIYEKRKKENYTTMLLEIPPGMSDEMNAEVILAHFLQAYERYHSHE